MEQDGTNNNDNIITTKKVEVRLDLFRQLFKRIYTPGITRTGTTICDPDTALAIF